MKHTPISIDPQEFPPVFRPLLGQVFDSSSSPEARVYYLPAQGGCYLKTGSRGTLKAEAEMNALFHCLGLGPEVLCYFSDSRDWLLTRQIHGEDCTHSRYLSDPCRLSETTAILLRSLHDRDVSALALPDRLQAYRDGCARSKKFEPELFLGVWDFTCRQEALDVIRECGPGLRADTLIHGDYCLPNILLRDWGFSGFIDLGGAGLGDRHMDLVWGLWTLEFNLHTRQYFDRFLDAYGRDRVDPEMLRAVAAMEVLT